MSSLIWCQSVGHTDGIPERFFIEKADFEKKSADDKKHKKLPRRQRVKRNMVHVGETGPEVENFFMLNSIEHEISTAHKN